MGFGDFFIKLQMYYYTSSAWPFSISHISKQSKKAVSKMMNTMKKIKDDNDKRK
jgi:hypothetical protein